MEEQVKFEQMSQFEDLGLHYIALCEKEVCKMTDLSKFKLSYHKFDWSARRRSSRGGWYPSQGGAGINLAMHHTCGAHLKNRRPEDPFRVYEYKSFDADPVIGGFITTSHEHYLAMVVAHEVAHAAQYFRKYAIKKSAGNPHGHIWKQIYRHLRETVVNPLLPDQEKMSIIYEDYKKALISNKKKDEIDWIAVHAQLETLMNEKRRGRRAASPPQN
jgi:hypothetical protein